MTTAEITLQIWETLLARILTESDTADGLRSVSKHEPDLNDSYVSLDAFTKFRRATINFVMPILLSVCLSSRHETTRLPLDGF